MTGEGPFTIIILFELKQFEIEQLESKQLERRPPTKQIPTPEEHIGAVLHRTSVAIRCALDAAIAAQVSPELTGLRGMALGYIAACQQRGEPVYQRDLENRFHINRSSVTAMLQGLEQSGFITRTAVEQDARLKSLSPTPKGLACNEAVHTCVRDFETRLRSGIPREQLEITCQVIGQLIRNVDDMTAELNNEKKG